MSGIENSLDYDFARFEIGVGDSVSPLVIYINLVTSLSELFDCRNFVHVITLSEFYRKSRCFC
jgi:hypothetical protein